MLQVAEVVAARPEGALVVRVSLPEDEDVIAIPERDAVPGVVVDLPADAGGVQQIEDDRVVEDPVPPETVGRDPPRGSGRQIEPVRPRRTEEGAEVFPAERELVEETVVKGQLGRGVVPHRFDPVRHEEAVHHTDLPLAVYVRPRVADVRRREARELVWEDDATRAIRLRVARGRPEAGSLNLRRVAKVMVERAVLLAGDDHMAERQPA